MKKDYFCINPSCRFHVLAPITAAEYYYIEYEGSVIPVGHKADASPTDKIQNTKKSQKRILIHNMHGDAMYFCETCYTAIELTVII